MTITVFMIVSCINFALQYSAVMLRPGRLFNDVEVRTYLGILFASTLAAILFGLGHSDFASTPDAVRYALFQVTSILTNTGFATHDFDQWNESGRGLLFLLMFVGGCAGSTSCSIKVIRHVILWKILGHRVEKSYRPTVVRLIRVGSDTLDRQIGNHVVFYFGLFAVAFVVAWMGLVAIESDASWIGSGHSLQEKMIDCASGVGATINGVGPG
jgi:trk system potassium uptake protein TrkH